MKHVAVYLRVSTEGVKNGKEQDTAMQLLDIQNYLKSKGINEFEIYEDKGFKGADRNRPALKKLMQDCRHGKVSTVVCWKLDRLFRSLRDLMNTLSEFESLSIEFISVKDSIDMSTASGRLLFQILGAFGEFEAATIRERVRAGLANAKAKGVKLGRPKSVGHNVLDALRAEGKNGPEIARITGMSLRSVYRGLNKEKSPA